ncbi:hypothetical protein MKX03_036040 [Papaver bracteatum]|nr:hypothetical protein MKX03_036040 [Papaver bracteatum]
MLFFTILLTSIIVSTIACFYASKDITYQKVIGVLRKCCGRLIFTFFWAFFMGAIYTSLALGLLLWFFRGVDDLRLLDPRVTVLNYMLVVLNVAMAVTALENDYGIKGLAKNMRLIFGKIWISCVVYGLLEIAFTGIILPFCYLVIFGKKMNLVGRIFVMRIPCYLLTIIWIHFSLVRLTVVYLICKSYRNKDIPTATHAAVVPIIYLIWLVIKTFN